VCGPRDRFGSSVLESAGSLATTRRSSTAFPATSRWAGEPGDGGPRSKRALRRTRLSRGAGLAAEHPTRFSDVGATAPPPSSRRRVGPPRTRHPPRVPRGQTTSGRPNDRPSSRSARQVRQSSCSSWGSRHTSTFAGHEDATRSMMTRRGETRGEDAVRPRHPRDDEWGHDSKSQGEPGLPCCRACGEWGAPPHAGVASSRRSTRDFEGDLAD